MLTPLVDKYILEVGTSWRNVCMAAVGHTEKVLEVIWLLHELLSVYYTKLMGDNAPSVSFCGIRYSSCSISASPPRTCFRDISGDFVAPPSTY